MTNMVCLPEMGVEVRMPASLHTVQQSSFPACHSAPLALQGLFIDASCYSRLSVVRAITSSIPKTMHTTWEQLKGRLACKLCACAHQHVCLGAHEQAEMVTKESDAVFGNDQSTGINFDAYDEIPVETSGNDVSAGCMSWSDM